MFLRLESMFILNRLRLAKTLEKLELYYTPRGQE
jgi:hypothetical protein